MIKKVLPSVIHFKKWHLIQKEKTMNGKLKKSAKIPSEFDELQNIYYFPKNKSNFLYGNLLILAFPSNSREENGTNG